MKPRISKELWSLMAWDISDAFAKTEDDHYFDLGIDAIEECLPAFIEACLVTQAELDRKANTNG